jgi:hypothetical protein
MLPDQSAALHQFYHVSQQQTIDDGRRAGRSAVMGTNRIGRARRPARLGAAFAQTPSEGGSLEPADFGPACRRDTAAPGRRAGRGSEWTCAERTQTAQSPSQYAALIWADWLREVTVKSPL